MLLQLFNIPEEGGIARYIRGKIAERGVVYCLKRFCQQILFWLFSNCVGLLAYPLCRLMKTRFVPIYVGAIGHLCIEVDCYLKEEILGRRPKYLSIVPAARGTVANNHLLRYWQKCGLKVVESPFLCFFLVPLSKNRFSGYDTQKYVFGYRPPFPEIQRRYHGKPPLLSLTDYDRKRGWECTERLGMPKGSWFVCLHCREDSYLGNVNQSNRSCDIHTYLPAVEFITRRGGWVVRLGDPNMKLIPRMERVIDYAHSDAKCDWMDIFLAASCKFFLASNSGLCHVPRVFGRPSAIANYSPLSTVLSCGTEDIGIPKLVWSIAQNRYLTFREIFDSPISNYRWDSSFRKERVTVMNNQSDDIKAIAEEMLQRSEGTVRYTEEDDQLQKRFKSLMKPGHYSYGAISRVGRDFLRKYKELLVP